jgi:hypothetical protein
MMSEEHYYDAGAGAWRAEGDDAWLGERLEDDVNDAPEWRDREEPPEPPKEEKRDGDDPPENSDDGDDPTDDADEDDPMDDPAFRVALRGQRELSGHFVNNGRRRGNHPTGFRGRGMRFRPMIRPTGRQLGAAAPATGRPSYADAPDLVPRLLGPERVAVLRASFKKRGANAEERAARIYLAVLLRALASTAANRAAAELLDADLRKIGDLRRREYDPSAVEAALQEIAVRLLPPRKRRRRKTT